VLDAGINYIDVAVDYGEAEEHIGRCIPAAVTSFSWPPVRLPAGRERFTPSEARDTAPRYPDSTTTAVSIYRPVNQSCGVCRPILDVLQFHFSPAKEVLEREGAIKRSRTSSKSEDSLPGRFLFPANLIDHTDVACSTSSKFRIQPCSQSMRQPIAEAAQAGAASSSAAACRASQVRGRLGRRLELWGSAAG